MRDSEVALLVSIVLLLVVLTLLVLFHKFESILTGDAVRNDRVFSARGTGVWAAKLRLRSILVLYETRAAVRSLFPMLN